MPGGLECRKRLSGFLANDNGPELTAASLAEWAELHGVILGFIQPQWPAPILVTVYPLVINVKTFTPQKLPDASVTEAPAI